MYIDFDKDNYTIVLNFIDDIVYDNNYFSSLYTLKYKTPIEFKTQLGYK